MILPWRAGGGVEEDCASSARGSVRQRRRDLTVAAARRGACLLVLAAWASPAATHAQDLAVAPLVLSTPGSTRALALGNAYTALGADPDAIFYNPAQLVAARGISIGLQRYGARSSLMNLSAVSVLAPGTIGIGVQLLDQASSAASFRDLADRGESALFVRGSTLATGAVASLAYARPAFFGTRVGVAGKVIHQQFGNGRDLTGAFDIGVAHGSTLQLALVGRNLGHGIRLGSATIALPREVAFGTALPRREIGPLDLAATASVSMLAGGTLAGGGGTEWSYMPLDGFTFAARIGYRAVERAESHLTLGGGFVGERVSLDYAFQAPDGARSAHRIGIRWR